MWMTQKWDANEIKWNKNTLRFALTEVQCVQLTHRYLFLLSNELIILEPLLFSFLFLVTWGTQNGSLWMCRDYGITPRASFWKRTRDIQTANSAYLQLSRSRTGSISWVAPRTIVSTSGTCKHGTSSRNWKATLTQSWVYPVILLRTRLRQAL